MAEKRNGEDNVSVQVMRINEVDKAIFYRGVRPIYQKNNNCRMTKTEYSAGTVLDDRFEITECISRSGMASIFKAHRPQDRPDRGHEGAAHAVRERSGRVSAGSSARRRSARPEPSLHPENHSGGGERAGPTSSWSICEGQTLARPAERKSSRCPRPDAVDIASRICEALEYMHEQDVIHRDLKPQNIMLCNDGTIRIMDFGIAKAAQARRMTFAGFTPAMGTPDYMAPEQVKGKRGDERTDIYSLGAMLYEMVTGSTPFEGENPYVIMNARLTGDPVAPRKVNPKLTPVLEEIILHAMERDPANRYPSAAAMKAELDDYEKVQLTERWQRLQPPQIWKSRYRMVPIIAGMVLLNIALFLALWWYLSTAKKHGH